MEAKQRGALKGVEHWHACGVACVRKARSMWDRTPDHGLALYTSRQWLKRACAAFLFAGGEGWDLTRKMLNLSEADELWLERWRS